MTIPTIFAVIVFIIANVILLYILCIPNVDKNKYYQTVFLIITLILAFVLANWGNDQKKIPGTTVINGISISKVK